MRYLKTFESYSGGEVAPDLEMDAQKEKVLSDAFEQLSDAEKEQAFAAVEELAKKMGCSVEDLANPEFAKRELQEAGAQAQGSLEEGFLGDLGARAKKAFGWVLSGLGIGTAISGGLAGLLSTILGIAAGAPDYRVDWMWNETLRNLSSGQQAGMFVGGIAALGISVIAGMYLHSKGKELRR